MRHADIIIYFGQIFKTVTDSDRSHYVCQSHLTLCQCELSQAYNRACLHIEDYSYFRKWIFSFCRAHVPNFIWGITSDTIHGNNDFCLITWIWLKWIASITWWHHQTFSALLAICAGNSPVPGEFPAQRPVMRSFDIFFDLRLNKRLSKQSLG